MTVIEASSPYSYYQVNKARISAKNKKLRAEGKLKEDPEKKKARGRTYYKQNSQKVIEHQRQYALDNPEKMSARYRKYSYGITHEQFEVMLSAQGGRCAICSVEFSEDNKVLKPHVDHNHDTNAIRGLLCGHCNSGLGMFKDDPARLQQAIQYLTLPMWAFKELTE